MPGTTLCFFLVFQAFFQLPQKTLFFSLKHFSAIQYLLPKNSRVSRRFIVETLFFSRETFIANSKRIRLPLKGKRAIF